MAAILLKWTPIWWIQSHDVFGNTFSEIYAPQNLDIESKLKALRLLVSEIEVLLRKWPPFCLNGLQNGGYNGMMYSAILFLKCTPQKTYIYTVESTMMALRLLVSEMYGDIAAIF